MGKPLRVLIVEDSEDDALLVIRELGRGYDTTFERVETAEAMTAALEKQAWDIITADYKMPHFSAPEALELLQQSGLDLPFIVVSGTIGEDTAVETMKAGAHDYLMKDNLARLVPAVERELHDAEVRKERKQAEEELRKSQERAQFLANVLESSSQPFAVGYSDGRLRTFNTAYCELLGYSRGELHELKRDTELTPPEWQKVAAKAAEEIIRTRQPRRFEKEYIRKDGSLVPVEVFVNPIFDSKGDLEYFFSFFTDITERKEAEEALKLAYAELDQIFNATADAIRVIDKDFNMLRANEAYMTLSGVSKDEAVDKKCYDVLRCPRCHSPSCSLTQILNGEERIEVEEERERGDGTRISCIVTVTPFRQPDGKVIGIVSTIKDITERKRAEEALQEAEERYRSVIQSAHDMIQSVEPDGKFIFVNPAWLQTLGYTEAELPGLNLFNIIHPESLAHCQELFAKVMRGESVRNIQATFIAKDGREIVVEGNAAARYVGSNIVSTQGVFRDITERKQAEERIIHLTNVLRALRGINQLITREKDKERLIQQSCNILVETRGYSIAWILLLDEDGNYISAAGSGAEKTLPILLEQMKRGEYPPCVHEILAQEPPFVACDDVKKRHIECGLADNCAGGVGIANQLEYEGKIYGIVCVAVPPELAPDEEEQGLFRELATDVSSALARIEREEERKRVEEKLQEAEALKELDRLRSELMANISHELRTPLASIKGFASTLLQPDVKWSEEEQRDFLQSIDQEADRLTRLISDLLDMSRLEAGALKLEKRDYRVSEILDSVSDRLASLTEHHQLEVIAPAELPPVFVDEMRIGQVLTNMVENATKYSKEDSQITIEAQLAEDLVIISVTDRGQGIAPELLDRVFDRFYQTESIVTGRKSGTGLGLSICRGIIEAHGGRIWVESKLGEGSKFSLNLPVSQREEKVG